MTLTRTRPMGGRCGARRLLPAAVAFILTVTAAAVSASGSDDPPHIAIGRQGEAYTVSARFVVAHPPALVHDVLTDYEGIPEFVPDVTRSVVRTLDDGRTVVEQEAVSRVLFFSKTVQLRLAIDETPRTVHFRDELGTSFTQYEGHWRLEPVPQGTVVTYQLVAQPAFGVPAFLVRRLLSRDAGEMIEHLRAEMDARSATPTR